METAVETLFLTNLGPWGLVSVCVTLIFFGGLVPRWIHNQRVNDKDVLIARLTAALDKRDEQFGKLFDQNKLIVELLEDIKHAGQPVRPRQETGTI